MRAVPQSRCRLGHLVGQVDHPDQRRRVIQPDPPRNRAGTSSAATRAATFTRWAFERPPCPSRTGQRPPQRPAGHSRRPADPDRSAVQQGRECSAAGNPLARSGPVEVPGPVARHGHGTAVRSLLPITLACDNFSAGVGAFVRAALGMRMLPEGKRRQSVSRLPGCLAQAVHRREHRQADTRRALKPQCRVAERARPWNTGCPSMAGRPAGDRATAQATTPFGSYECPNPQRLDSESLMRQFAEGGGRRGRHYRREVAAAKLIVASGPRAGRAGQWPAIWPPSMCRISPVMNGDDSRKRMPPTMSLTWPTRPRGWSPASAS